MPVRELARDVQRLDESNHPKFTASQLPVLGYLSRKMPVTVLISNISLHPGPVSVPFGVGEIQVNVNFVSELQL